MNTWVDHLQSTSNTSGDTTSGSQYYYPYGETRSSAEVATEYQYTGQRWQSALGLYYYRARWYDPAMRRFVQADTIVPEPGNPQSLNRYAYCQNNPIKYMDPSGMFTEQELLEFGFDQNQINEWRADSDWWGLISLAQLGDQVLGAHWCFDGWTEMAGGMFALGGGVHPGTSQPFNRLRLEGYQGSLEDYRNTTRGRSLWRKSGGEWEHHAHGIATLREPGRFVGYRIAASFHPERVDWVSVGLDAATIGTMGAAGLVRFADNLADIGSLSAALDAAQMGGGIQATGTGTRTDRATAVIELAVSLFFMYQPGPMTQTIGACYDLSNDLGSLVEFEHLPLMAYD